MLLSLLPLAFATLISVSPIGSCVDLAMDVSSAVVLKRADTAILTFYFLL
jgi:hypothetical protein